MPELSDEDRESLERLKKAADEQWQKLKEGKGRPYPNPDKFKDPVGLDWEGKPLPNRQRDSDSQRESSSR